MALSVDDVLTRRTRVRLQNRRAALAAADYVADLLAAELDWSDEQRRASIAEFVDECAREDAAAVVAEKELW
jgi:glycerol-3-phosphate dehydrogenase